jgi:hypothetical protein
VASRVACASRVAGQRDVTGRAVEIGGHARFALEGTAGERRKAAQIARGDLQPAVNLLRREQAGIAGVEVA